MTIPFRERGYSIELDTLIVHERYQDHAPEARRTSAIGVNNVRIQRGYGELIPCEVCFPPPPKHTRRVRTKDAAELAREREIEQWRAEIAKPPRVIYPDGTTEDMVAVASTEPGFVPPHYPDTSTATDISVTTQPAQESETD